MVIVSIWASMAAWFTPTVLFCVTNLIIATIFIASNNNDNKHHNHGDSFGRIARVSSFIERARSMKLPPSFTTTASESQQYPSQTQSKTVNYSSSSRLALSIHSSSSYVTPNELSIGSEMSQIQSESERDPPSQSVQAPSLLERVKSIKFSSFYGEKTFQTESELISNTPGQLLRSPSFLDRVKSFKISSAYKSGSSATQPENADTRLSHNPDHHVNRSKSDKTWDNKSVVGMKTSRSEMRMRPDDEEDVDMRRPATARERRNVDDEEVDAKADDFISRFRQQLKLQRLESLVRYNERLNRGA